MGVPTAIQKASSSVLAVQPFLDVRTAVLNDTLEETPSAIATPASSPPTMTTGRRQPRRDHSPRF